MAESRNGDSQYGSDALDRIVARLQRAENPRRRYEYVLWLSKKLPPLTSKTRSTAVKVKGCVSQVLVGGQLCGGHMCWQGDSDALITKGLLALLIEGLEGLTSDEVQAVDPSFITDTGLNTSLTPSRANGFLNIFRTMQNIAAQQAEFTS
ncbi:cysteine desulfuration protein SufE [cyanobiont of Ornithocercus magnificus]|nr:cysteine desulfuration protein SufE [cyanobiont of Ornithocercus magnificus]